MDLYKVILNIIFLGIVNSSAITYGDDKYIADKSNLREKERMPDNVFNGVYSECFLHLSYSCLQKKTLLYLKELNNLSEVSVIGDYVKFVKINTTDLPDAEDSNPGNTGELAFMIDKAVDDFFDNHVLKFNALGQDISVPPQLEEFVGRKKRKGGGGGGGMMMMGGHGGGHDDGGKKKMMMMAMMCMKMKLMMMVPAMMGMMGMMSFKGMMFSMMSFMLSKVMLLMKILEKKGGAGGLGGGGGGGGGDGGWPAGGGGGGAWMPAGGQDFGGGGGGGGGYDANGQWQSRSIAENLALNKPNTYYKHFDDENLKLHTKYSSSSNNDDANLNGDVGRKTVILKPDFANMPEVSYVKPVVRYNNKIKTEVLKKPVLVYNKYNVDFSNYEQGLNTDINSVKNDNEVNFPEVFPRSKRSLTKDKAYFYGKYVKETKPEFEMDKSFDNINEELNKSENKTRNKRSILDLLQNSYMYWMNKILGVNNNRRTNLQKYKIINGVRYVYYPFRTQRPKMPKEIQLTSSVKLADEFKPIITAEDFNKGEIMEGAIESRTIKKKYKKIKDSMNETMDMIEDNPWQ